MKDVKALILFSHGSLLCGSGEALEAHTERLRASGKWDIVSYGYLNYTDPLFVVAAEAAVQQGATDVMVAPYFLVPGYFVSKALPAALAPVRERFPNVAWTVGEPLGRDAALADAIWESALGARREEGWEVPLRRAARSCRPSPECPLYGTPDCPKVPHPPQSDAEGEEVRNA